MNYVMLAGFFGLLIWIIQQFGIEHALAAGTAITGAAWLIHRLVKGPVERDALPAYAEYARSFFPIFLVVLVLRAFVAEPFRIPSGSMMPTLLIGDFILVNKFAYGLRMPVTRDKILETGEPERGDIVVFRYPVNPRFDYIKRVVGLPGDRIRYRDKTLYVNGRPQPVESVGPYQPVGSGTRALGSIEAIETLDGVRHRILVNPMAPDFNPSCTFLGHREVVVPEGHYLMVGDNRDDSNDGRCWGFVPEENLVGKAFLIWFSIDWQRPGIIAWERIGTLVR